MRYELPWYIEKCGCARSVCNKYSVMCSNSVDEINENCVIQGGWAGITKDVAEYIVACVNGVKVNSLEKYPTPWHTEPCFTEKEGEDCWCFEIHDASDTVIILYGEVSKDAATLIVERVNDGIR